MLSKYKGQQSVERGFRFLKDLGLMLAIFRDQKRISKRSLSLSKNLIPLLCPKEDQVLILLNSQDLCNSTNCSSNVLRKMNQQQIYWYCLLVALLQKIEMQNQGIQDQRQHQELNQLQLVIWYVSDKSTLGLTTEFYSHLNSLNITKRKL